MFFRISSTAFDWYPMIRDFVEKADFHIESVTIVQGAEGAEGRNRPYKTLNGQGIYRAGLHCFLASLLKQIGRDILRIRLRGNPRIADTKLDVQPILLRGQGEMAQSDAQIDLLHIPHRVADKAFGVL